MEVKTTACQSFSNGPQIQVSGFSICGPNEKNICIVDVDDD